MGGKIKHIIIPQSIKSFQHTGCYLKPCNLVPNPTHTSRTSSCDDFSRYRLIFKNAVIQMLHNFHCDYDIINQEWGTFGPPDILSVLKASVKALYMH